MCTLTIIPRESGYLLGMNRDERLDRAAACAPQHYVLQGVTAVYPRDGAGGTWIAANERGIALALLNWSDTPQPAKPKVRSRGEVIPALIGRTSLAEVADELARLDLQDLWPFRLLGVFPGEQAIGEWRWNGATLAAGAYPWKVLHCFSSGLSDARAEVQRGAVCELHWRQGDAGTASWLRRLHASHDSGPGPFSVCVHRDEVETLSYTELAWDKSGLDCRYRAGSPCATHGDVLTIHLGRPR